MNNRSASRRLPISSRPWFIYVVLLPVFFGAVVTLSR